MLIIKPILKLSLTSSLFPFHNFFKNRGSQIKCYAHRHFFSSLFYHFQQRIPGNGSIKLIYACVSKLEHLDLDEKGPCAGPCALESALPAPAQPWPPCRVRLRTDSPETSSFLLGNAVRHLRSWKSVPEGPHVCFHGLFGPFPWICHLEDRPHYQFAHF